MIIFFAVLHGLAQFSFTYANIIEKQFRDIDIPVLGVWYQYRFLIPLFAGIAFTSTLFIETNFNYSYFAFMGIWLFFCMAHNSLSLYLYKFKHLSQLKAIVFLSTSFGALVIDIILFKYVFSYLYLFGFFIIILGLNLFKTFHSNKSEPSKLPKEIFFFIIVFLTVCILSSMAYHKETVLLQSNIVFHSAFSNVLFYSSFIIIYKILYNNRKQSLIHEKIKNNISIRTIIFINFLTLFACLVEAIGFRYLPLSFLVMIGGLCPILMFSISDYIKYRNNKYAYILIIFGFIFILTASL